MKISTAGFNVPVVRSSAWTWRSWRRWRRMPAWGTEASAGWQVKKKSQRICFEFCATDISPLQHNSFCYYNMRRQLSMKYLFVCAEHLREMTVWMTKWTLHFPHWHHEREHVISVISEYFDFMSYFSSSQHVSWIRWPRSVWQRTVTAFDMNMESLTRR